jgi:hypothetical protein
MHSDPEFLFDLVFYKDKGLNVTASVADPDPLGSVRIRNFYPRSGYGSELSS